MVPSGPSLLAIIRQQWIVPAVLLVVMLLALVNWILRPDDALRWLRGMLMLPGLWLGMMLWHLSTLKSRRRLGMSNESSIVRNFGSTIALLFLPIGLLQIIAVGLKIWSQIGGQGADLDVERRFLGLASSAVLVIIGNALPRILTPFSILPRKQAELVAATRRFVGTTLLILGLVAAIAFLWAPLAFATSLMRWVTGAVLLTVLGAIAWMNVSAARRQG